MPIGDVTGKYGRFRIRELFKIINEIPEIFNRIDSRLAGDFSFDRALNDLNTEIKDELKKLNKHKRECVLSAFGFIGHNLSRVDKGEAGEVGGKIHELVNRAGLYD